MKKINSLSGGKTSSYLAMNYKADYNIFSLVCVDDYSCKPKDKKVIQRVNDKLNNYGYTEKYGDFIGTAENDKILNVMLELEQMLGSEIIWVRGDSFETVIKKHGNVVPNMARRFCTSDMKMRPIGEFVYHNIMDKDDMQPVFSNVGFRWDEQHRAKKTKEEREIRMKLVVGKRGSRNKWEEVFWGVANYPLIYNEINHFDVAKYWSDKNIDFPEDSNCVGCFWKDPQQLRKNYDDSPNKMDWFNKMEKNSNYNWKSNITYDKIKKIGIQSDFIFGTGSGCQAGFCTD